jgi:hypothetical protein
VTDLTDRAAVVDEIIAERPSTITVYRPNGTGETALTPFTGRIDESGTSPRWMTPPHEGPVAIMPFVLLCPQDHRVVKKGDTIKAVDESGTTSWYYVESTRDHGFKEECVMVARDRA